METISADETVLQFGTGKFLRAFTDLMIHQLNGSESPVGRVVAVQSTGSERAEALNRRRGRYHVAIRGWESGERVDRTIQVESIRRALVARDAWPAVVDVARNPAVATVVSNTTEAGYASDPRDGPADSPPRSFPARLLRLLRARYEAGLGGVTVLPCELVEDNATQLRDRVLQLASQWQLAADLVDWIRDACSWRATLVDRIVAAPPADDPLAAEDPLLAVAEPFALWLIQGTERPTPLAPHPAVRHVDRLEPYHLRKVRILNGAHTALVAKALPMGIRTVRQAIEDPRIRPWLESLLWDEILPVLEGRTEEPEAFAQTTIERFANPYLEHRLADIALHHQTKLRTRLLPTYQEFRQRFRRTPPRLHEILHDVLGGGHE